MTELTGGPGPLRRITLAIDASAVSAKAVSFVLSKFQADPLVGKGGRAPVHVSVVHVMARRPLAPIEFRFAAPWIKSEKKAKDVANRLVKQCGHHLIQAGFTAEPIYKIGDRAEEIIQVASKQKADRNGG